MVQACRSRCDVPIPGTSTAVSASPCHPEGTLDPVGAAGNAGHSGSPWTFSLSFQSHLWYLSLAAASESPSRSFARSGWHSPVHCRPEGRRTHQHPPDHTAEGPYRRSTRKARSVFQRLGTPASSRSNQVFPACLRPAIQLPCWPRLLKTRSMAGCKR